ncbi:hypothetical protein [Amycolatopsis sp. PS_44_ISF1]|uniref:hypothetical protein n=1 Tax=Amycolatopsis sp. PS_44_ISF1 TaxID=2974917 RepID=UPI0028E0677F|nr:hypothetical protein [Amycolatopsis sp. PS_44_ISF1]MDT8915179.1 hypothetical protein [Amycolatopsis sp. PS_44_ISF1]
MDGGTAVRPRSVTIALGLWPASSVASIVGAILALTETDVRIDDQAQGAASGQAVAAHSVVLTVVTLVLVALWRVFLFAMRAERNGARVVLTILGALSIISLGLGGIGVVEGILQIAGSLLTLLAIIFQHRPDANAYFRKP